MKTIGSGPRRSFAVTFGTRPGYAPCGVPRSPDEVQEIVLDWMEARLKETKFILTGVLTPGQALYAYPGGRGHEPVCVFAGEVSVLYCADVADGDVEVALNELADLLAEKLGQTRVYVSYAEFAWVRERESGQPSPSGEPK